MLGYYSPSLRSVYAVSPGKKVTSAEFCSKILQESVAVAVTTAVHGRNEMM
jgi:hypothetical protein